VEAWRVARGQEGAARQAARTGRPDRDAKRQMERGRLKSRPLICRTQPRGGLGIWQARYLKGGCSFRSLRSCWWRAPRPTVRLDVFGHETCRLADVPGAKVTTERLITEKGVRRGATSRVFTFAAPSGGARASLPGGSPRRSSRPSASTSDGRGSRTTEKVLSARHPVARNFIAGVG